ncbi:hypothetical protein [Natronosalvus vescus]|uniref:hypothetical protein n=1 Tax=Natronosalvus vescus TaxID=2953881 RepID=UPI00209020DE|nr:hypothetical protein [Natronosalvus vescus]
MTDYQVEITGAGSVDIEGAIIAHSIYFQNPANNVDLKPIDNSDIDVIPEGYEPAPQLIHLNIVEQEIEINNK